MAAESRDVDDVTRNEAQVPDLLPPGTPVFIDINRLRSPETLTQVSDYESEYQPFTDEEQLMFAAAFKVSLSTSNRRAQDKRHELQDLLHSILRRLLCML